MAMNFQVILQRGRTFVKLKNISRKLSISLSRDFSEQNPLIRPCILSRSVVAHRGGATQDSLILRRYTGQIQRPYVDPKFSYAFGRSQEHLAYSTVDRELRKRVQRGPDDVMFSSHAENIRVTCSQFNHDVNKLSKGLIKELNIRKGDPIGVFAYNCYNWLVAQFACSRVGAILMPINPSYKSHELAYILKKGQVKCLLMPGPKSVQSELNNHIDVLSSNEVDEFFRAKEIALESVILVDSENSYDEDELKKLSEIARLPASCRLQSWAKVQDNDGKIYESTMEAEEAGADMNQACIIDPEYVGPEDLFAVYYTSGTTGSPKGACVSQFCVINNVRFAQMRVCAGRPNWRPVVATCLPMFHIFAGVLTALSPIINQTHLILSSHKYDIEAFCKCIVENRADLVTVTPTMLIDLVAYVESKELKNFPLKMIQCGGAALPPEMVAKTFKALPNLEQFRLGYGSTENGAVSTMQTIFEPDETRMKTVGSPIEFTEVRIAKVGSEEVVPLMEQGEIQTRGHNTMTEYLGDVKKTAEVLTQNRWYRTGDIGFMHPHGSIEVSGRIKHMIIKGGENIYPEEVRQLVHKLEYVEDAHIIGVPDKRFGEQVCAWVKLKEGYSEAKSKEDRSGANKIHPDDIIEYCKGKITYFKVPKYIIFVDDFPMTLTKKAQAHVMTEKSIEILGLQEHLTSK